MSSARLVVEGVVPSSVTLAHKLNSRAFTDHAYHTVVLTMVSLINDLFESIECDATLDEYLDHSGELFTTIDDNDRVEEWLVSNADGLYKLYLNHLPEDLMANNITELNLDPKLLVQTVCELTEDIMRNTIILMSNKGYRTDNVRPKSVIWEPFVTTHGVEFPTNITFVVTD